MATMMGLPNIIISLILTCQVAGECHLDTNATTSVGSLNTSIDREHRVLFNTVRFRDSSRSQSDEASSSIYFAFETFLVRN